MDMWHRDENKYNTKKFNADLDLLDVDFSEDLLASYRSHNDEGVEDDEEAAAKKLEKKKKKRARRGKIPKNEEEAREESD
jgi:hypothetical protein